MKYTSLNVRPETASRVKEQGKYGESMDQIINKILDHWTTCDPILKDLNSPYSPQ